MISSYDYYSHFTDGKVKSEESNPPNFSAAGLGLNLLCRLTLSLCSWELLGRVLGEAGLCDCDCVGVEGDVQPSDSPGVSPTLPGPAQPSRTTPHHSDLLSPWSSLLHARQLQPHDHNLCFSVENSPKKKASCWHWRKKWCLLVRKMLFGRDNTRIDEALLCGQRSTDLARTLNRW